MKTWSRYACSVLFLFGCTARDLLLAQNVEGSFERTLNVSGPLERDVSTGSGFMPALNHHQRILKTLDAIHFASAIAIR